MLALAAERKDHVSTRSEDLACGAAESRRRRRLSTQRKAAAVQRLIRGESLEAVSRDLGVPAHRLSEWRDRFLAGAENALKARESSPQDDEIARADGDHRQDNRGERASPREDREARERRPFSSAEVDKVSQTTSPSAEKPYGFEAVCRVWNVGKSTYYRRRREEANAGPPLRQRGPKPKHSDEGVAAHAHRAIVDAPSAARAVSRSGIAC